MASDTEPVRENNPTPDAGSESNTQQRYTNPNVPPASNVPTFPPTETHYTITCKPEKDWWDKTKIILEIFGVVFLAIYTAYTIKMYCANKKAADAAQSAAKTAKETLDSTREDRRAWVGPVEVILPDFGRTANDHFGVWIKNSGRTPARKVVTKISTQFIPSDADLTPVYKNVGLTESVSVIQPEMRIAIKSLAYPAVINRPEMKELRSGKKTLYMYGLITYEDVFHHPHWTKFCVYLSPDLAGFGACNKYNDTDD